MSFIAENPKMAFARGSKGTHRLCLFITRTVTLWFVIQTSVTKGLVQDQYFGCFYDISRPKSNADLSYDNALTIESCIAKCPTTYATIQNGNACRCREDYGAQLPDKSCNLTCSGNSNELCGGLMDQLNAYVVYTACPIGTYGAACDKGCHCQREVPCDRNAGNCPDGCYGNWSGSACNITAVSQQYIGCYRDFVENRSLGECVFCKTDNYHNNTLEFCSESCAARNYSYAGPEAGVCCFCGENYARYGLLSESNCSAPCSGNPLQKCGGPWANIVYSVCPAGYYGPNCRNQCHCNNNGRCVYLTGECNSACKAGWTGNSCNIRDCKTKNGDCSQNETCATVNLNFATITGCRCLPGFERKAFQEICRDTDECELGVCDASTTECTNTIGGYNCACKSGYRQYNETTCYDIDECRLGVCDSSTTDCTNTIEGYNCACKPGYRQYNENTCYDVNECALNIHNCVYVTEECRNTNGSFFCNCKKGFQRKNDTCEDVDECISSPCGDSALCLNTRGSYHCNKVYSVGDVIGAAVGSAVGAAAFFAIILIVVIVFRRRRLEREKCEVANQIRHKDGTSETPVDPKRDYETLGKTPNPIDSSYAELEFKGH